MLTQGWDFGPIGNLTWRYFPEAREVVKDLVCEELQRAIDSNRDPAIVDDSEYALHAVGPLFFDRLGRADLDPDLVRRFCLFCRALLRYSGPDDVNVSYTFNMYILDGVDYPAAVHVLRRADPDLVDLVRTRYPGRWSEGS